VVLEVLLAVLAGVGIGLSLAAPPGPVNAIIASHTVTRSLRAGFLVGLGATTADTIFLAVSVLAHSAVASLRGWIPFIALVGAGFMMYLAWSTARAWRGADTILDSKPEEHAKSYATGLSVNITSPYPFIWWLTVGLVLIDQLGPAVLVGFFGGLILWITAFPIALREAQRHIAQTYHAVLLFSIVCLAAFAAWLVWSAAVALL
jgi:threonine/homoserine/homoserine lactone efflux protein